MSNARNLSNLKPSTSGLIEADDITDASITPAKLSQKLISGTVLATTSGVLKDFTGIPSWAKRITVMLSGVSTNGTSQPVIQIGSSAGITTTGYSTNTTSITSGANLTTAYTNGWQFYSSLSANTISANLVLTLIDPATNLWTGSGLFQVNIPGVILMAGTKALPGTLDRVRLTTTNGTDTFDAGSVNILYE